MRLPIGIDYVELDVRIDSAGTRAGVSIRPVGKTDERTYDFAFPTGATPVLATKRIYLGTAATQWELRFYCRGGTPNCTVSNVRFGTDVPGWSYYPSEDWFAIKGPDISPIRTSVQTISLHGIAPQNGPFLAFQIPDQDWAGARRFISMLSPVIQLPVFSTNQPLTLGMDWARVLTTTVGLDQTASGFEVWFAPLNGQLWERVLMVTDSGVSTSWSHKDGDPFPTALSGQRGRLVLYKTRGLMPHVFAIDSLTFSLDGQAYRIPADQLVGKCKCEMGGQVQLIFGDPVNTYSGSAYLHTTDLAVSSSGPALGFERTYASLFSDATTYPATALGPGWRHSFGGSLTLPGQTGSEPNTVIYEAPSGNRLRFFETGISDTTLEAAPGVRASLMRVANLYTLTLRDQSTLQFDTQGRLTQQRDPQGHIQTLTYYSAPGQAWDGQLEHVTDAVTQRSLSFSYTAVNGQPRLERVADPLNHAVQFTYTANGDLATVTDLRGGVTTYSYSGSTHLLTTIQDPLLVTRLTNTYDSQRRVSQQLDASGLVVTFTYTTTTDGPVTTITQQRPGTPADVVIDHYRPDGSLRFQEHNGRFLGYTAFDRSLAPTVQVDASGEATQIQNDSVGLPTVLTDATGRTSTMSYGISRQPTQIVGADGITTTASYDVAGNLTQTSSAGAGGLRVTSAYTSTTDNRPLEQRTPDGVVTRYAYDTLGQVISATVGYGTSLSHTTSYGYDALGQVVTTTVGVGTALARTDVTHYNADGTVHETIQGYVDGVFDPHQPDADVITTFGYDLLGRHTWTRDALGHYTATHYDAAGRVNWTARNFAAAGWSGGSLPTTPPAYDLAQPDANVATFYGYDAFGRTELVTQTGILTGTFDPATLRFSDSTTRVTRTEYDSLSRPVTVTLNYHPGLPAGADTNVQTLTYYDGIGNPTWQRDALGRWTRTEYDQLSRPVTTTVNYENGDPLTVDASNTSWTDGSDTDLISVTRYDTAGRVERQIDNYVNGAFTITEPITDRVTFFQYDSLSRPITTTQVYAPNQSWQDINRTSITAYDPVSGRALGQQGWDPVWVSRQYDLLGRLTATIQNCRTAQGVAVASGCASFNALRPDRNVGTTTRYDALGRAYERVDALGTVTHTTFDRLGRGVAATQNYIATGPTTPITNVTALATYDALGATTVTTDALGYATHFSMNGLGQTAVVTDTMDRVTRMGYDGSGTLRWVKRNDGQLTVYQLDGLGRTVATIVNYQDGEVAVGEVVDRDLTSRTVYDAAGRRMQAIDPAGGVTAFAYDLQDRLVAVTENAISGFCARPPCNLVTHYRYDRLGNRTAIVDPRGSVRRFEYDAADRMIRAIDPLGHVTFWDYAGSRLFELNAPNGMDLQYWHDELGRVTEIGALDWGPTLETHYDALGRRVASVMPEHGQTTYHYDPLGQITQVDAPGTGTVQYGYDERGQRTQLVYPDGTSIDYAYWPDGQLKSVKQGSTTLSRYYYDSDGRPWITYWANETAVTTYGYDNAGRLAGSDVATHAPGQGYVETASFHYTLDRLGRRVAADEGLIGTYGRDVSYSYDGVGRLASAVETPGTRYDYTYDDSGNRTTVRVNTVLTESRSYNAANQVIGWTYDNAGNLLNDGTTTYAYDPLNRLRQRGTTSYLYNADGALVVQSTPSSTISYTQDLAAPLSQVLQKTAGGTTTDYLYGTERLGALSGGTSTWEVHDGLGSVRQTFDVGGTVLGNFNYDPWGQVESGNVPTFGFTGELQDAASDIVYLRARWYNASAGTFTAYRWRTDESNDFAPSTHHPYVYALSNPVLYRDPTGKCVPQWVPFYGEEHCTLSEGIGKWQIDTDAGYKAGQAIAAPVAAMAQDVYEYRNPQKWVDATINNGASMLLPPGTTESVATIQGVVGIGRDLSSGDAYHGLHGLSTLELNLLLFKYMRRNTAPSRSLFNAGQTEELCTTSAPDIADWRRLRWIAEEPDVRGFFERLLRRPGLYDPMTERFGANVPKHVAVQNLDGSITDRTILYNIQVANGGRLPSELERYRKYDTFDSGTYNKLLDTWHDIWEQSSSNVSTNSPGHAGNLGTPLEPGGLEDFLNSIGWGE